MSTASVKWRRAEAGSLADDGKECELDQRKGLPVGHDQFPRECKGLFIEPSGNGNVAAIKRDTSQQMQEDGLEPTIPRGSAGREPLFGKGQRGCGVVLLSEGR